MPITQRIRRDVLFVKREAMGSNVKRPNPERDTLHIYEAISPI